MLSSQVAICPSSIVPVEKSCAGWRGDDEGPAVSSRIVQPTAASDSITSRIPIMKHSGPVPDTCCCQLRNTNAVSILILSISFDIFVWYYYELWWIRWGSLVPLNSPLKFNFLDPAFKDCFNEMGSLSLISSPSLIGIHTVAFSYFSEQTDQLP